MFGFLLQRTGLVVQSKSVETVTCSSAVAAEKQTFTDLLSDSMEIFGDQLKVITTDGHVGIAAHMRKQNAVCHNQVNNYTMIIYILSFGVIGV